MLVCHCFGINDRRIEIEVGLGATDAEDIARRCGAGSDCGGCYDMIEDILEIKSPRASANAALLAS